MHLTLTLVRHGQTVDNTKQLWAGHRDSPLTNRGIAQATALGQALKSEKIDKIYCSDLKRAKWTAAEIYKAQTSVPGAPKAPTSTSAPDEEEDDDRPAKKFKRSPGLTQPIESELLREQNFGIYEGADWTEMKTSSVRQAGFEGGEGSLDVARRAKIVVEHVIKPWMLQTHLSQKPKHIVIVAHGIFNAEFRTALLSLDPGAVLQSSFPMPNTGYHRFRLCLSNVAEAVTLDSAQRQELNSLTQASESFRQRDFAAAGARQLEIQVRHLGMFSDHLKTVKKMGTLGSVAWSPQQRTVADMFSKT